MATKYRLIANPDYPKDGRRYIQEHTHVAERALGKRLPKGAVVHHINDNGLDNRPENLVICPGGGYHRMLHLRSAILRRGGDVAREKICRRCDQLLPLDHFALDAAKPSGRGCWCRVCRRHYDRHRPRFIA